MTNLSADIISTSTITKAEAEEVHRKLRHGFESQLYLPLKARRKALKALRAGIKKYENELFEGLKADFQKPAFESYTTEIGFCFQEIDHTLAHLSEWARPESKPVSMMLWPTTAESRYVPKGVALIISPWNYPVNLALAPLIAAIAAGCTIALKPAEDTPNTSIVLGKIIAECFSDQHVLVVQGSGSTIVPALMEAGRFDHVFYTGSTSVGRKLGKQCGEELISCTLELGGKSPAIVMDDAKLDSTVDRIVWGKFLNAGQTCVAPDYVLVQKEVYPEFLRKLKEKIKYSYGDNPQQSPDFARIISDKHFDRLTELLQHANVAHGGQSDHTERFIAPTVLTEVDLDGPIMEAEIFGPILPLIPFASWEEAKSIISRNPNPLASYLFSSSKATKERWINEISFGGGCFNDAVIHLGIPDLPFGGVQQSGLGRYHSVEGFRCFSNQKSIASTSATINIKTRFAPYKSIYLKAVKWILE